MILERLFGFDPAHHNVKTELLAGVTTFMTMCYILATNPAILSTTGMDKGALFTATALTAAISTFLLAVMAKLPFAQAPSMGLNAFFAFTMCLSMGFSWQQSLAIMFIEGILFLLITLFNVRNLIMKCLPTNLRYAISTGIGMFIAFIGFKNAGIVVSNADTCVSLGEFTPSCLLGILSIVVSAVLLVRQVKGALFYGILSATVIGILAGVSEVPQGWMPVSAPNSMAPVFCKFDFSAICSFKAVMVIFSLLIVNIFDTLGTLVGLADKVGITQPDGSIPYMKEAMMSDAIGTTCSAMLGSSSITTYVESASGISDGGRTGLTAAFVALLFLLSIFFAPLFLLIPSAATSGALVMVGVLMMGSFKNIPLDDLTEAFPAFVTMIMMVLCYSIADGVCLGILSYVLVKALTGRWHQLNATLWALAILFVVNYTFG